MNKMNARFTLAAMAAMALASAAQAATTITVDSVVQRWPWNNKLDITYTVNDGQDVSASTFKMIVFTAVVGGTTYTIDGVTDVGASANTGTHTVTWTVPSGVKDANCTMTAAVRFFALHGEENTTFRPICPKTKYHWAKNGLVLNRADC